MKQKSTVYKKNNRPTYIHLTKKERKGKTVEEIQPLRKSKEKKE